MAALIERKTAQRIGCGNLQTMYSFTVYLPTDMVL